MSAIGDTILTTPVACRLRDWFPDAMIAWAVEEKSAHFVKDHPAIDEVIVLPRGWFLSFKKARALAERLRPMRFDAAIDCQSNTKSSLACRLSGAPLRIGCRGRYGSELSPWLNNRLIEPERPHLTDRTLELLAGLGVSAPLTEAQCEPVRWDLANHPEARDSVCQWAPTEHPNGFAVINPGATWESKLWENDRFGELASRMGHQLDLKSLVVWGSAREKEMAEQIVATSSGQAELAPRTSLHELAELLRLARLVVSPDTGPMHLAVAVGAPTVGLFGATHPDDCGPYGKPNLAVQRQHQQGSRKQRRRADNTAMRAISVDDAWAACLDVYNNTRHAFDPPLSAIAS